MTRRGVPYAVGLYATGTLAAVEISAGQPFWAALGMLATLGYLVALFTAVEPQ